MIRNKQRLSTALATLALICAACTASVGESGNHADDQGGTDDPGTSSGTLDVGRIPLHRLTRDEYNNTVRDLTGLDTNAGSFIVGGTGVGFENEAFLLRDISQALGEGYFAAAKTISAQVFADETLRARIVTCQPAAAGDTACAAQIIAEFGKRAFRRPLAEEEIQRLTEHYSEALELGLDHEGAVQHLVRIFLSSPNFLFHIELDDAPTSEEPHEVGQFELASRLSYMLWSSLPDAQLFELAEKGELNNEDVLAAEVERLLDDPRSQGFIDNFLNRWLGVDLLTSHVADTEVYPEWSSALATDMANEMQAYLTEFVDTPKPWSQFLSTDINFITPALAGVYGMTAPGDSMTRVEDTTDKRQGFLGLAGFLTYTSRADRTAPTFRAKIILESLLCTTLSVPPDVPSLEDTAPAELDFPTIRDRLAQHRASPDCASCHDALDPIGFSLENFDAIGSWRDVYENGVPVDATGELDGQPIQGLAELVPILSQDERFLACPPEKLMSYALRRNIKGDDRLFVADVLEKWGGGTLRELVKVVVQSRAFRFRRGEEQ